VQAATLPRLKAFRFGDWRADALLDEILEGMTAGADDYLVKPLDPDDLQARLIAAARVTCLHRQLAQQRTELQSLNQELTAIARRDPLTGLGNRRALQEDLELLEARVTRYGHRYCMALFDVDHFKAYNDAYGHQAGDEVLHAVAAQLKDKARSGDAIYRYGGEEYLCIFPEQSLATGIHAVQRMRIGVERLGRHARRQPASRSDRQRRTGDAGPRAHQIRQCSDQGSRRSALPRQAARPKPSRARAPETRRAARTRRAHRRRRTGGTGRARSARCVPASRLGTAHIDINGAFSSSLSRV
jgi:diguanylate cyclase (GGDEF)-like protein